MATTSNFGMTEDSLKTNPTRRSAIKTAAGASVLAGVAIPHVHAQVNEELKISLIGCGGRGTGAVKNALSVSGTLGPLKLHAMADVFEDKLERSHQTLVKDPTVGEKIDVSPDRKFIGFDGYKNAMDSMKEGDIAILTTPCAFRWPRPTAPAVSLLPATPRTATRPMAGTASTPVSRTPRT